MSRVLPLVMAVGMMMTLTGERVGDDHGRLRGPVGEGPGYDSRPPRPIPSASPASGRSLSMPDAHRRTGGRWAGPPGPSVSGIASWYCEPGRSPCTRGFPASCLCAAAGPALRALLGPDWRGMTVTVTAPDGREVSARLIDTCGCPDGRVLDLYAKAFRRLAPLGQGLVADVRVEL